MPMISMKELLSDARSRRYAVPMFDVSDTAMIRAAVETAEELRAPVMLAAIPPDIAGDSLGYWANSALYAARRAGVPVAVHLDHAATEEECVRAAEAGFNSVMIDASSRPFDENAAISRRVVERMRPLGVEVEAELGHVASGVTGAADCGRRDGVAADGENVFTDPGAVVRFVEETGVAALAVSIGTIHGVYVSAPKLEIGLLKRINAVSPVPLVLHGGSGTPADQLARAVENGIAKINIYSELTAAWDTAMRDFLNARGDHMTCWFSVSHAAPDRAMRETMRAKFRAFNAAGKA